MELDRVDEAIVQLKKAIDYNTEKSISYYNIALCYVIKKDEKMKIRNIKNF